MTKIAILCPTMGRPEICKTMIESIIKTAFDMNSIIIYLGITEGDETKQAYIDLVKEYKERKLQIGLYEFPDWTLPMCHNKLSEIAKDQELHYGMGDDCLFVTPGWDKALIDAYEKLDNKIHVFSLLDNRDPKGMPASIITKAYIDAMGWRLPPYFMHWYCDTWTAEIAKACNILTHLKDYMLVHDKKSEQGIKDATYHRVRQRGGVDRDGWINQKCQHFLDVEKARLMEAICAVG